MNALYIVDPNKTGAEHSSLDACTIRALFLEAKAIGWELRLYCSRTHREIIYPWFRKSRYDSKRVDGNAWSVMREVLDS